MAENAKNNATTTGGDRNGNKTTAIIEQKKSEQAFVPIKGRIRQMETNEDAVKQSKNEDNHFKRNGNGKQEIDPLPAAPSADSEVDSNKMQGGNVSVPTPLPRTSRNNSMTDPSSSEESSSGTGSPRPSPMPRVTIGSGYKVPNECILFD